MMDAKHSPVRLILAVAPSAIVPFLASLAYFVFCSESRWIQGLYAVAKAFTMLWPAIATVFIIRGSIPRPRPGVHHVRAIPLGVVVGLAIAGVILYLAAGPFQPLLTASRPQIQGKVSAMGIGGHFVWFALGLSIVHSLLEEFAWRWFVFGQLSRAVPMVLAHTMAAAAFSAHHVVIASQFFGLGWGLLLGAGVGVGGALFSMLYQRQRTLVGAWIAHIFADLAIMSVGQQLLVGRWW